MNTPPNTPEKVVNNYFNLPGTGSSDKKPDYSRDSTEYIIHQNNTLHTKVETLNRKIHLLRNKNEELENDNGALERSKTNIKGYVNNLVSYKIDSKKLVNIYNYRIQSISKSDDKEFIRFIINSSVIPVGNPSSPLDINYVAVFLTLELLYICFNISIKRYIEILPILLLNLLFFAFAFNVWKKYSNLIKSITEISNEPKIIKIKESMTESEKGNEYLSDLINLL